MGTVVFAFQPNASSLPSMNRLLPLCLTASLLPSTLYAQSTWIVDQGGSGDFTDLQNAVDTVAAGDTLLVLPGGYGSVLVQKSISILGDPDLEAPDLFSLVV